MSGSTYNSVLRISGGVSCGLYALGHLADQWGSNLEPRHAHSGRRSLKWPDIAQCMGLYTTFYINS